MPQSRKWQLTINNPADHGFSHDVIFEQLNKFASVLYWCLCDEVGSEGTYHTHVYKTRSVMERYGYDNCYRVTDYKHPFDTYDGQDVIIFEEFRGGLKHGDMLNYLDGYPLLLPCRYFNRQACYTKVFIISNIPPTDQYTSVDRESVKAFFRRIHKVVEYVGPSFSVEYNGVDAWIRRDDFQKISNFN